MAELLKDRYNETFFNELTTGLKMVYPQFNQETFLYQVHDDLWDGRALKDRMHHIANVLNKVLPQDFIKSVDIITKLVNHLKLIRGDSFEYMFLPDYIEKNGLDDFNASTKAFEQITQFTSCEFAVRPFIIKYPIK